MSRQRESRSFVADFETTVYDYQDKTEVWAAAIVELYTEDVVILGSIEEFISYLFTLKTNVNVAFHNLKFDGSFILYDLMTRLTKKGFVHAFDEEKQRFMKLKDMPRRSFSYLISSMGQWYQITIKNGQQIIKITDSLKLLPFSVENIGKDFKTKHKKLTMKYEGYRYPGCEITEEEKEYIKNDVLVIKEALEIFIAEGHDKLTIGSCCLEEYKKTVHDCDYDVMYPNIYEIPIDPESYGAPSVGAYVRRAYKGAFCYYAKGKEGRVFKNGITLDVTSLYPSMMHSCSGNYFPTGKPIFVKGYIPDFLEKDNENFSHYYFFVRVKMDFELKPGKIPCIQIKQNKLYKGTEWLETSFLRHDKLGKVKIEGLDTRPTLTLTCSDWYLIKDHYDLFNVEVLDCCYFLSNIGMFDEYIDKYIKIKNESEGAVRGISKLFLNNLYGQESTSTESSFKVAYINDAGGLSYRTIKAYEKKPGYIPIGAAITSYARRFTITAAQLNYHGVDKPGFIYADTDSLHLDMKLEDVVGVVIHNAKLCTWKIEAEWSEAIFVRQKTYIEKVNGKYKITCAGMPKSCKKVLAASLSGEIPEGEDFYEEQLEFMKVKRELKDFKKGIRIFGKLKPTQIKGGTLLVPGYFEIR